MSKISYLQVTNFLGVNELKLEPGKINIFKGPKGSGKTSIIEAIEKTFLNKDRRTEVIKHGEEEATLFVECTDGLEVDRKIRSEKSNYLKIRNQKTQEGIPSTEKFLRDLVNGHIFRPIDWINMSVKEQTDSLLAMLEIGWDPDDITNWFGDLPSNIDYSQHILLILKLIEQKYYKDREEVNREIKELKARIRAIEDDLPAEYNGEEWRNKDVQSYYSKVKEAQDINKWIAEAKGLKENFNSKVESIKASGENNKSRISLKYKNESEDIKDILDLAKNKIEKAKDFIANSDRELSLQVQELENKSAYEINRTTEVYNRDLQALEEEYMRRKDNLKSTYEFAVEGINNSLNESVELKKREINSKVDEQKDLIGINENKIASKEQELNSLSEKEELEKMSVDEKVAAAIEKEEVRIGKAARYLEEHEEIDIQPLQDEANYVQEMVSYLRDWDRIIDIRDGKLAEKERISALLTTRIEKARTMPSELLKTAKMPVEGISVDVEGRVRINGTLIDGLSDGEKLELAMKVAKAQCGPLKVICLDKFESLDEKSQKLLLSEMENDDYEYFVTQVMDTVDGNIEIEKIGEVI